MKKLSSVLLAVLVTLSCVFVLSSFTDAAAAGIEESNVVDAQLEEALYEGYISFSVTIKEMGYWACTCYEDFIIGYDPESETMDEYIARLIEDDIEMCNIIRNNTANIEKEEDAEYLEAIEAREAGLLSKDEEDMLQKYEQLMDYIDDNGYNVYLPYSSFVEGYQRMEEYLPLLLQPMSSTSQWYDNIGNKDNPPVLPQAATYGTYNLLDNVTRGDIVQETQGGIAYYTGHIAIIEGQFYDEGYGQFYLRTIEAGTTGVVYGVLDDDRYDYRGVNVYYVTNATSTHKIGAVSFCKSQVGKRYNYAAVLGGGGGECQYSSNTSQWYCSELVWAAYYNQGINLYGSTIPQNVYLPAGLARSYALTKRTVSKI